MRRDRFTKRLRVEVLEPRYLPSAFMFLSPDPADATDSERIQVTRRTGATPLAADITADVEQSGARIWGDIAPEYGLAASATLQATGSVRGRLTSAEFLVAAHLDAALPSERIPGQWAETRVEHLTAAGRAVLRGYGHLTLHLEVRVAASDFVGYESHGHAAMQETAAASTAVVDVTARGRFTVVVLVTTDTRNVGMHPETYDDAYTEVVSDQTDTSAQVTVQALTAQVTGSLESAITRSWAAADERDNWERERLSASTLNAVSLVTFRGEASAATAVATYEMAGSAFDGANDWRFGEGDGGQASATIQVSPRGRGAGAASLVVQLHDGVTENTQTLAVPQFFSGERTARVGAARETPSANPLNEVPELAALRDRILEEFPSTFPLDPYVARSRHSGR